MQNNGRLYLLEVAADKRMSRMAVRVALGALLVWSLGVRLWYATPGLDSTRFWDERYPLENVESIVKDGSLRPANGLHPALTHLPHAAILKTSHLIHQRAGAAAFAVFDANGHFNSTAYLVCRVLQTLFGTLSILLLFLIGRRLGGDRLGLLAAFLLAAVPYHIHASVKFMADGMLIFTLVLAFYLSLRAVTNPGRLSYGIAGVAIGLALSSKFNAGPIAIPLVVGTFLARERSWRTFRYLVLAGTASVIVFLLLNPYVLIDFEIYRSSFGRTLRVYERHGQGAGIDSPLRLFQFAVEALVSPMIHGKVVGALAIAGAVLVGFVSVRDLRKTEVARYWLMVLSYLVAYPTLYAVSTSNPDSHNWLPLSPFLALTAAWMLVTLGERLSKLLPKRVARRVRAAAIALIVIALTWTATSFTYKAVVPTTGDRALAVLAKELRRPPPGRLVISEHAFRFWNRPTRHLRRRLAVWVVEDLRSMPRARLKLSDGEVFPASRLLDSVAGSFYQDRLDRLEPSQIFMIEPELFGAWGPALVAVTHPMRSIGKPAKGVWVRSEDDRRLYVAELPEVENRGTIVSLEFGLPGRLVDAEIEAGDQSFHSITFRAAHRNRYQTTPRFRYSRDVVLRLKRPLKATVIPFEMRRWRKGWPTHDRNQE